jgi:hypothetical protein
LGAHLRDFFETCFTHLSLFGHTLETLLKLVLTFYFSAHLGTILKLVFDIFFLWAHFGDFFGILFWHLCLKGTCERLLWNFCTNTLELPLWIPLKTLSFTKHIRKTS